MASAHPRNDAAIGFGVAPSVALTLHRPRRIAAGDSPRDGAGPALRYGFPWGEVGLLFSPDTVCEVIVEPRISPLPGAPEWLAGLVNVRGTLVPAFDLRALVEVPRGAGEQRYLLVLDREDRALGMLVDRLPERVDTAHSVVPPPPVPAVLEAHAGAAFRDRDAVWIEFDHAGFFDALKNRAA